MGAAFNCTWKSRVLAVGCHRLRDHCAVRSRVESVFGHAAPLHYRWNLCKHSLCTCVHGKLLLR